MINVLQNVTPVTEIFLINTVFAELVSIVISSKANISEHIKNILNDGELQKEATVRFFRTVGIEGNRTVTREIEHYNLDMIISLGYRVNSKIATQQTDVLYNIVFGFCRCIC